jgi:methionyl-tRNA formyltransferase
MREKLKIIYMGTPAFSVAPLEKLYHAGHEIVAVYTVRPKAVGRGLEVKKSPVQLWAEAHHIPVFTPKSLRKDQDAQAYFLTHRVDVAVVAAYGLILPEAVLNHPRYGCLNIHVSLLPRWRGAAPIQRAILNGDDKTGICIMQMDAGLDTGDILLQEEVPITAKTTSQSLFHEMSHLGAEMVLKAIDALAQNNPYPPKPQSEDGITLAPMLEKHEGYVDFKRHSFIHIDRMLRALTPWPGVSFTFKGEQIKIHAIEKSDLCGEAGVLLDDQLTIAGQDGKGITFKDVQPPNKKTISGRDFVNGARLKKGDVMA